DAGQRGELEHSEGLPAQLAHGCLGLLSGDERPGPCGACHWMPVRGGGIAESAALGDRLTEKVEQRVVNARVLDAGGRWKKLHGVSGPPAGSSVGGSLTITSRICLLPIGCGSDRPTRQNSSALATG